MKRVLTFTLWGNSPKYTIGSIKNAQLAQTHYPDFECWFYVHVETVPQNIIDTLNTLPNVKIIFKSGNLNTIKPLMWRFEAIDDPEVEIMLSRNTDTRILLREKLAVDEWLNSNKSFHIMRDHPHHDEFILGGMFGTKKMSAIPSWSNIINKFIQFNGNYETIFLEKYIYPTILNDCIIHASFCKKESFCLNFPIEYDLNREYVGGHVYEDDSLVIEYNNLLLAHTTGSWIYSALNYNIDNDIINVSLYNCEGNIIHSKTKINRKFNYLNNNGEIQIEKCENLVICLPGNQVGNCLRTISSMYLLAKTKNMNFCINLTRVHSEKEKYIIKHLFPYINLVADTGNLIHYSQCTRLTKDCCTNYHLINESTIDINNEILNKNIITITEAIHSIIPSIYDETEFIKQKLKFYKENAYFEHLNRYYNEFINNNNLTDGYISIHIRYTDNLTDTSKHGLNTPLNVFYDKLETISAKKILICSDNITIINRLKNKNMYYFPNSINNDLLQPVYEMFLLSKSKLIIGSTSSTFSYESAFFEGTDIELYENNEWVLYELSKYKY